VCELAQLQVEQYEVAQQAVVEDKSTLKRSSL